MSSVLRIKDQPVSERPRERLVNQGADVLSNAELIAILLRTGLKGMNAVEVGKQLLARFGSLQSLALASVEDLCKVKGIGRDKAVTLVAAFALATKLGFAGPRSWAVAGVLALLTFGGWGRPSVPKKR